MSHAKKISAVTDAELPLKVVARPYKDPNWPFNKIRGALQDYFGCDTPRYVKTHGLRSSKTVLISERFLACQGIAFYDPTGKVGALAHNYPSDDPSDFLTGRLYDKGIVEDLFKVFPDMRRVEAVHVYHSDEHSWPEVWMESTLRTMGVQNVRHVSVKFQNKGVISSMDVALDARKGAVYVFPNDVDYGLKLDLRKI